MQAEQARNQEWRRVWIWLVALTVFTALYRVMPRVALPPDASFFWHLMPVGALGLFAGARLRSRYAALVPLAAMLLSDLLLWRPLAALGYSPFSWQTPFIYLSFALNALLGRLLLRRDESAPMVLGGAALLASVQFFLMTNFAVWLTGDGTHYPKTLAGLGQCYLMGIPFFRNTLAGDLLFTGLFFGLYALAGHLAARRSSEGAEARDGRVAA